MNASFLILMPIFFFGLINASILVPIAIYSLYTNTKYSSFIVALFFGLWGYFFIPNPEMDLFRYFESFDEFVSGGKLHFYRDFGLSFVYQTLEFLGADHHFLSFVSAFLLYYLLMKIAKIAIIKYNKKNINALFISCLFIFSVPITLYTGLRFSSAMIIFTYGVCVFFEGSRKKGVGLFILSPLVHFSLLLPIAVFLFSQAVIYKKSYSKYTCLFALVISLFLGFMFNYLIEYVINIVNVINDSLFTFRLFNTDYFTGEWGASRSDIYSFSQMMIYNVKQYMLIILVFVYISKVEVVTPVVIFITILSSLCFFLMSSGTFFFRYIEIAFILILYDTAKNIKFDCKVNLTVILICLYILFSQFFEIYGLRYELISSYFNVFRLSYLGLYLNQI